MRAAFLSLFARPVLAPSEDIDRDMEHDSSAGEMVTPDSADTLPLEPLGLPPACVEKNESRRAPTHDSADTLSLEPLGLPPARVEMESESLSSLSQQSIMLACRHPHVSGIGQRLLDMEGALDRLVSQKASQTDDVASGECMILAAISRLRDGIAALEHELHSLIAQLVRDQCAGSIAPRELDAVTKPAINVACDATPAACVRVGFDIDEHSTLVLSLDVCEIISLSPAPFEPAAVPCGPQLAPAPPVCAAAVASIVTIPMVQPHISVHHDVSVDTPPAVGLSLDVCDALVAANTARPPGCAAVWDDPSALDWSELANLGPVLAMNAGDDIGGDDAAMDYDDAVSFLMQNGMLENEAEAIIAEMPTAVTYDEYIKYVTRLDRDGVEYLLEWGADGEYSESAFAEAFEVTIILEGADIQDMSTDDLFAILPDDATPIGFARACVLMGAETRADMLSQYS